MPHLCSSHCFSFPYFSEIGRTSYIPHLWIPYPTFVEWNSFLQMITFAQMGFRSLSFILQAYLNPTSKPAIVLPCLVPKLIKSSLCLDEFSSKMKEPDVALWGKGREIKRQRTERRCPGLASGLWLCWDRAQSSSSNGLATNPGCLLLMTFLGTSPGI